MKTISFKATEIVTIGLVNLTQCPECKVFIHYNGLPPRYCSQGHAIRPTPVTPAGGTDGTRTRL